MSNQGVCITALDTASLLNTRRKNIKMHQNYPKTIPFLFLFLTVLKLLFKKGHWIHHLWSIYLIPKCVSCQSMQKLNVLTKTMPSVPSDKLVNSHLNTFKTWHYQRMASWSSYRDPRSCLEDLLLAARWWHGGIIVHLNGALPRTLQPLCEPSLKILAP